MARQAAIDIHKFRARLVHAEMRLHNPLSERNIELIRDFEKQLFAESLSTGKAVRGVW